ncbi:hypothetical protein [Kineococcus aurantiacus]|uniref:Uncharacterized protein n=1 Tax=Kineococcus aurantiacus TaxID=37633 RepID=A0A7Y9DLS2_9ACTN|nr:hypothetical protein [Kineococcus aurantiacus]NYD22962.1 hypothetical protein [Kineococcus aurantiacus]
METTGFDRARTGGRSAGPLGGAAVLLGAWAWGLAASSTSAARAGELAALRGDHTAQMPGEGELVLLAHDARLAGMVAVAAGAGLLLGRRRGAVAGWAAAVAALVVANVALGHRVDGWDPPAAAAALLGAVAAVTALAVLAARRVGRPVGRPAPSSRAWDLAPGVLAAVTVPVLVLQGFGTDRYRPWLPADLGASDLVAAVASLLVVAGCALRCARTRGAARVAVLMPLACLVVLLEPSGGSVQVRGQLWAAGAALVTALAPFVLPGARSPWVRPLVLAAVGVAVGLVPALLVVPAVVGGVVSMAVLAPAGAVIGYDGLPVVGGALLLAPVGLLVVTLLPSDRPRTGPA